MFDKNQTMINEPFLSIFISAYSLVVIVAGKIQFRKKKMSVEGARERRKGGKGEICSRINLVGFAT